MVIALLGLILLAVLFPGFMRAVFVGFIALFVLAFILTPSHAGDGPADGFPEYDVERNCGVLFKSNAGFYNQCIDEDEYAYRYLQLIWPSIPDEARNFCIDHTNSLLRNGAGLVGGIYSGVIDCVIARKAKYDAEHPDQPRRKFTP